MKSGDYVRTNDGVIGKITKIVTDHIFYVQFYNNEPWKTDVEEAGIIKSSPNMIDLIEVGDYVNGEKVYAIGENSGDVYIRDLQEFILAKNIKSIVTKEQFEEIEYKL